MPHPIARAALLDAGKAHALNLKLDPDQAVEIHTARELRPHRSQIQFTRQRLDQFHGKERDLALVVGLVIKEPVPADAAPGDALDLLNGQDRMFAGRLAMMAKKLWPGEINR